MNIPTITAQDWVPLWPALILTLGATVLLMSEVFSQRHTSRAYQGVLAAITALLAGVTALSNAFQPAHGVFLGFGVLDPFSSFLTVVVCIGLLLATLLASGFLRQRNAERGEFYALMLFASAGMSLLAMSAELITLFINLEVLSVATYALTSYLRRGPRPSEAGFKYFILGAFSSALLLYGIALLYGATGTTLLYTGTSDVGRMASIATALPAAFADPNKKMLIFAAILLIAAGFAFKIAAVPFHMWTPDVYEGAPTPVTALMSVGVKAAAFAAMLRVFLVLGTATDPKLAMTLFSTLAFLTMVGGNLLALPQRNVKRMLAYSSIAHAGYILLGVAALFAVPSTPNEFHLLGSTTMSVASEATGFRSDTLRAILFYLLAYTVTSAGSFGAIAALERREDEDKPFAWDLDRFSGLATRRPGWAVAMAVFMLSLGGIPPTIGFMGKLLLFRSAVDAGLVGLAVVGMLTSAAAVYYYLRVVVYMFMRPAPEGQIAPERHWGTEIALVLSSVTVVVLGVVPGSLSDWLAKAGTLFLGN